MTQKRAFHVSSLRLLIVDDEPLIRQGIRNGLSTIEGVEIIGECGSGAHATEAILAKDPDLVLLDVQMPDCTGLDVVRRIGPQRMPAVVFITAYDEYAVAAFELNAVDYILKPFDDDRLRATVNRARQRISGNRQAALVQQLQALLETKHRAWPERLVDCGPKQHVLAETLTNLDKRLNPDKFLRIHRCRIVNVSRVAGARPFLSGTYQLELHNGTRLGTGRQYHDAVRGLLRK